MIEYDWGGKNLYIRAEDEIGKYHLQVPMSPDHANESAVLTEFHHKLELEAPTVCGRIMIFVDAETESYPSVNMRKANGEGRLVLARIVIHGLTWYDKVLWYMGKINTLYMTHVVPPASGYGVAERLGD